jgi:hypothetical protein
MEELTRNLGPGVDLPSEKPVARPGGHGALATREEAKTMTNYLAANFGD